MNQLQRVTDQSIAAYEIKITRASGPLFSKLPTEVLKSLFLYLPPIQVNRVCKKFRAVFINYLKGPHEGGGLDLYIVKCLNLYGAQQTGLSVIQILKFLKSSNKNIPTLNNLDLSYCHLTPQQLKEIANKCPNLTYLNLRHTTGLESSIVEKKDTGETVWSLTKFEFDEMIETLKSLPNLTCLHIDAFFTDFMRFLKSKKYQLDDKIKNLKLLDVEIDFGDLSKSDFTEHYERFARDCEEAPDANALVSILSEENFTKIVKKITSLRAFQHRTTKQEQGSRELFNLFYTEQFKNLRYLDFGNLSEERISDVAAAAFPIEVRSLRFSLDDQGTINKLKIAEDVRFKNVTKLYINNVTAEVISFLRREQLLSLRSLSLQSNHSLDSIISDLTSLDTSNKMMLFQRITYLKLETPKIPTKFIQDLIGTSFGTQALPSLLILKLKVKEIDPEWISLVKKLSKTRPHLIIKDYSHPHAVTPFTGYYKDAILYRDCSRKEACSEELGQTLDIALLAFGAYFVYKDLPEYEETLNFFSIMQISLLAIGVLRTYKKDKPHLLRSVIPFLTLPLKFVAIFMILEEINKKLWYRRSATKDVVFQKK